MDYPITDIVVLEENPANHERFALLAESAEYWGVSGLLFQMSDKLVGRYVRQNNRDVMILIGGYASTGADRGEDRATRAANLRSALIGIGAREEYVIILREDETPAEIEHIVREALHAASVDILLPL
jgi:hypothetical protein